MVNPVVDKAGSQQMSVTLNQGAASYANKIIETKDREIDRSPVKKTAKEMNISELLEKNRNGSLAVDVLKPFFSKLAQVGITLGTRNKDGAPDDEELKNLIGRGESFEDMVEIKSDAPVITDVKRLKKQREESDPGRGFSRGQTEGEALALLKEYAALFTEYLAGQKPGLAERLKELKEKLQQAGIGEEKLSQFESELQSGRQADAGEQLKDAFILQTMANGVIEKSLRDRGLGDILENIKPEKKEALTERAKERAKSELKSFVLEELENVLIRKTFTQDRDFRDAMKLIRLGDKADFNSMQWLAKTWPQKKEDHGLFLLDVPPSATGLNVDTSTDNPSNRAPKHGFEYEKDDENEILINRLRALYMQRALKGDSFTHLQTEFKIRKLKNGLFKLGVLTKDLDEQVKHEAELVAKLKVVEMLKEALIERASFYELAGPAHQLVEKKIKGAVR
ncbi:MAG TPA: hypothetical protein VMT55_00580, partial [Candidatus Sulfotelmatobacter sp.]|nr:hypothetical protein [Candidatus Sulfotelmatobacter sp.]